MSIRQQLKSVLTRFGVKIESCDGRLSHHLLLLSSECCDLLQFLYDTGNGHTVRQCITRGIFPNAAKLHTTGVGVYRTIRDNHELYIHPMSVLYREVPPQW